jgi:hypothetical protein
MEVRVTTVYALDMPRKVVIQLRGVEHVNVLKADKVEQGDKQVVVKNGETVVGSFNSADVQGWWFEESNR